MVSSELQIVVDRLKRHNFESDSGLWCNGSTPNF